MCMVIIQHKMRKMKREKMARFENCPFTTNDHFDFGEKNGVLH